MKNKFKKAEKIRLMSLEYAKGNGPSSTTVEKPNRLTVRYLASKIGRRARSNTRAMRLKEMGMTYGEYIKSDHWNSFRSRYISEHGSGCEVSGCGNKGSILHHRSYDRLGFEFPEDVAFVCVECHDSVHRTARRMKCAKS